MLGSRMPSESMMRELRMLDRPRNANTTNLNLDGGLLPGSMTNPSPEAGDGDNILTSPHILKYYLIAAEVFFCSIVGRKPFSYTFTVPPLLSHLARPGC